LGGEGRGQAVNFGGGFCFAGMGLTGSGGLENGQEGSPLGICEAGGVAVAFNSASRAVRQLSDHGLVACLNPDAPRYRRYRLTETGRAVWETLQDLDAGRDRHNS
jgi:hypothetical protein